MKGRSVCCSRGSTNRNLVDYLWRELELTKAAAAVGVAASVVAAAVAAVAATKT